MPFKSEKQRRFLWAEHPEIARRWAHEYPESNKNLPTYANKSDKKEEKEKAAQIDISTLISEIADNWAFKPTSILASESDQNCKNADSKQEKVDIPHSAEPTYAGEEREKGMISTDVSAEGESECPKPENAINTLLQKLSVVLSPAIEQTIENMNAENEGRVARRVGNNRGLKQYPQATPQIPLPMGMQQPQPQQQPQQAKTNTPASTTPVGAGQSSATTDPIKFHSGLSASGIINGNAALSAPNTVNTKISAVKQAISVQQTHKKHRREDYFPKQIQNSTVNKREAEAIARAMAAAAPYGALDNTQVHLYGSNIGSLRKQMMNNPRSTPFQRWTADSPVNDPEYIGLPKKTQDTGDAYHLEGDTVWLPSGNPGVMMHELGHGIDFNGYPNDTPRMIGAGMYTRFAPTLWKEHAAWDKGQQYFLEGAAKHKLPPSLVMKTMEDAARAKRMGLGSYWGSGLGFAAGAGLGLAGTLATESPWPLVAGLIGGPILGASTGIALGNMAGESKYHGSREARDSYLQQYADAYAKQHNVTPEEAKKLIQSMARNKPQKKAANDKTLGQIMGINMPDPYELIDLEYDRVKTAIEKWSGKRLGLWDRIRMKKERGEKPAKPGDKDYPDSKSWSKVTAESEKKSGDNTPCSCGCGDTVSTCKCGPDCKCRQPGGSCYKSEKNAGSPAWQRSAGKNEEGGLNAKGRASYNRATGGHLKAPVTESNPSGDRAKRQNSFCSRMCGMKKHETGSKTKKDPDSRINKALRKWNCKCGSEKTAYSQTLDTLLSLPRMAPELLRHSLPTAALGTLAGAGYGALTGDIARNAFRGGLIGTGAGVGNAVGLTTGVAAAHDMGAASSDYLPTSFGIAGGTAGSFGGGLAGNSLYNFLESVFDKNKRKREKRSENFDPTMSRDAENAIMHGTGLIGSGALGTVAGLPISYGLDAIAQRNNWVPDSSKNPYGHAFVNSLINVPTIAGGMLGMRLYDNYILRPHMQRETERKIKEERVNQMMEAEKAEKFKKQAKASLGRVLGTALISTGGGLALGSYPGYKLQRASEAAGNSDFTNFVAGKAPIALAGALSAGMYNHWLDQYEQDQPQAKMKKKQKDEEPESPVLKYLQYMVH